MQDVFTQLARFRDSLLHNRPLRAHEEQTLSGIGAGLVAECRRLLEETASVISAVQAFEEERSERSPNKRESLSSFLADGEAAESAFGTPNDLRRRGALLNRLESGKHRLESGVQKLEQLTEALSQWQGQPLSDEVWLIARARLQLLQDYLVLLRSQLEGVERASGLLALQVVALIAQQQEQKGQRPHEQ